MYRPRPFSAGTPPGIQYIDFRVWSTPVVSSDLTPVLTDKRHAGTYELPWRGSLIRSVSCEDARIALNMDLFAAIDTDFESPSVTRGLDLADTFVCAFLLSYERLHV